MHIDSLNEICDAASCVASVGTDHIGGTLDTGVATPGGLGNGKPLYLVIQMASDIDSSGNGASVRFQLVSDSTSTIDDSSATKHITSPVFTEAQATEGTVILCVPLPGEGMAYERYLAIQIIVSGEDVTSGTVNAFLTATPQQWQGHADGVPTEA